MVRRSEDEVGDGLMVEREHSDDGRGRDKVEADEAWVRFDRGTAGWVGFTNCRFVLAECI